MGKLAPLALLLAGCGGLIEHDPPAITAVCVVELARTGESHAFPVPVHARGGQVKRACGA